MLHWNDEVIGESLAIARFVARKAKLAGQTDEEMARADMIAERVVDAFTSKITA